MKKKLLLADLPDESLMTSWWLPDESLMTSSWLTDDYLMTTWWLPYDSDDTDDSLMTLLWLFIDFLMTHESPWWQFDLTLILQKLKISLP